MGVWRYSRLIAFFVLFVQGGIAHAADRPLYAEPTGTIERTLPSGITSQLDLRALLTNPNIAEDLEWLPTNPPSWIAISGDTMTLTPVAPGASFRLTVRRKPKPGEEVDTGDTRTLKIVSANPPVWANTDLGKWPEDKLVSIDLTTLASQPDGEKLTFSIEDPRNNASWLKITGNKLEGTPVRGNVGTFDLILVATGATGLKAKKKGFGEVLKVADAPKFLVNPIILPDALEDLSYVQTINTTANVAKFEPEPITFSIVSGKPAWLNFDGNGGLSGIPARKDAGAVTLNVKLTQIVDGVSLTATTVVKFNVKTVNKAPIWSMDPIILPAAPVKKPVTADISGFARDIDGDALTFKKISGPVWGDFSAAGVFSGTPKNADVGQNEFVVEVSDGKLTAQARVQIKITNTPPTWNSNPVVLKNAKEDADYAEDLRTYVKDADGDLLGFEMLSGPNWITVNSDGTVKGIPRRADIGLHKLRVKVSDNVNSAVETEVQVTVIQINKAPEWTQNPIQLKDAPERLAYSETIAAFAKDIDGDALTFEKVSGPAWVTIGANGSVSGTPQRPDVGTATVVVKVKDKEPLSANVTVLINVLKVNRPPTWTKDPIVLPDATEDSPFSYSVASFAQDLDLDTLVFKMVSGPAWLKMLANGTLSGTPLLADVGNYTAVFEVTDGEGSATVNASGKVLKANRGPRWTINPIVLPDARADESYQQDISKFATDPDNDPLTFRKLTGPGWASVSTNGLFSGLPKSTDVGAASFTVEVSDGKLTAVVTVTLKVLKALLPPKWVQEPVLLPDALEGQMFGFSLLPLVTDPENDPLTFRLIRGPGWLTLSAAGQLTGIPQKTDVGSYTAVFEVSDGKFQVSVGAMGRVLPKNDPPTVDSNLLVFVIKERSNQTVDLLDPKYGIKDAEGDKLTFKLIDTRDWVALTAEGKLTMTPKHKDLGDYVLKFTVADSKNPAVNGTITIQVQPDPKPPTWKQDPIRFTAKAGKLFSATLADKVTDVDNFPLTFTKKVGPPWMAVNSDGTLTGTPAETDLGDNTFMVTAKNATLGSDVTVIVTVTTSNAPPVWAKDPIVLPDATVGLAYSQSLATYVTDADGDPIKFEKLSGNDWTFLTSAGLFIGVPENQDIGVNTFRVRARDSKNAFADVTVLIQVKTKNQPPAWNQNPINLGDAFTNTPFTFNLVPYVTNPDGDALTFKKISGPTWLQVSAGGQISGTPKDMDLGAYTAVFEVSDGRATAQVDAFGQVKTNNKPPSWSQNPINLGDALVDAVFSFDLAPFVINPDNDPLSFKKISGPAWLLVQANGKLSGTPKLADLGNYTAKFEVSDGITSVAVDGFGTVIKGASKKPKWLEDPIRFTAKENVLFTNTVAGKVTNPMPGTTLSFSKVSGPSWLNVVANGGLTGTPKTLDIGPNTFIVSAANPDGSSDVTVIIDVTKGETEGNDSIRIDEPVPGARADNLWVVDNSPTCSGNAKCLIYDLQKYIGVYFAALEKAGIHHLGMYFSSDACNYTKPIRDSYGRMLISWEDNDNADSFNERLSRSKGESRFNSPLTQMIRFFRDTPSMSGISPFYEKDVPLDTLVVTAHPDQYKTFATSGSISAGWAPVDFSDYYKKKAAAVPKPMRISAIAPKCPSGAFPSSYSDSDYCSYAGGENPYQTVVRETNGTYYTYTDRMSVQNALLDYADKVIFGAMVRAKKRIPLSGTPSDPKQIKVKLAGNLLPGNTGASTDKWTYDAATNEVIMYWDRIDLSTLKPGDRIEITYPKNASFKITLLN
jgi:hypothetical protein